MGAKVTALLESADSACETIGSGMLGAASALAQASLKSKKTTLDKLFASIGGDADRVTEEQFAGHLKGLKGAKFSPEQIQLLFKHISSQDAISRHRFRGLTE